MEGKLKILSESKLTTILIWRLQSNWQYSNTRQTHFEKEVSTELLKFKCSILVKPNHASKDAPYVLGTVKKYSSPVK